MWPGSRCPRCAAPIAWYDNVPLLSWLGCAAAAGACRAPISARYPLVEVADRRPGGAVAGALRRHALGGGRVRVRLRAARRLGRSTSTTASFPTSISLPGILVGLAAVGAGAGRRRPVGRVRRSVPRRRAPLGGRRRLPACRRHRGPRSRRRQAARHDRRVPRLAERSRRCCWWRRSPEASAGWPCIASRRGRDAGAPGAARARTAARLRAPPAPHAAAVRPVPGAGRPRRALRSGARAPLDAGCASG